MMEPDARELHDGLPVYRIPAANIEALRGRITKLSRRAVRLHMEPLTLTEFGAAVKTWTETIVDAGGFSHKVQRSIQLVLVTVTGNLPRVNGWAMAATIQHESDGNILRTVPGFDAGLPVRFRSADTGCDHCQTDRKRNDTYVLQSEAGEWKQVGRSCLADFLRTGDAAGLAEYAEMLANLDGDLSAMEDDFEAGERGFVMFPLSGLLAQVACIVRLDGWCSRTEAKNSFIPKLATVDAALDFFDRKAIQYMSADRREKYACTEADEQRATEAIAWAQSLPVDVANDYLWNLRVISHRDFIGWRETGLAGSMIAAYTRHLELELQRKYERETTLDEYFGTVGKREVFTLTVMAQRGIEGSYGLTTLVKFRDAAGRVSTWFCSGRAPEAFDLDATVIVKATVKAHEEYRGAKQTMLSRVAIHVEKPARARKIRTNATEVAA